MSLKQLGIVDKAVSEVVSSAEQLVEAMKQAAQQGDSFDSCERLVWEKIRRMGYAALELLIGLQGPGDLGSTTQTAAGQTLQRSAEPAPGTIRSIFGTHEFPQYTYSAVWSAAKILETDRAKQLAFTRHRLTRILEGDVTSVVRGLRATLTRRQLQGEPRKQLEGICNYLTTHAERVRYGEYLSAGYPIASGVIEGACRHLVKDRMERSGMRWTLEGARNMLYVRAAFQSSYWEHFQRDRVQREQTTLHPHRGLLRDYTPLQIAV